MVDECREDYICPIHRHPNADLVRVPEDDAPEVPDYRPWTAVDRNHDPAPRTYHSDRLGAVTIPED